MRDPNPRAQHRVRVSDNQTSQRGPSPQFAVGRAFTCPGAVQALVLGSCPRQTGEVREAVFNERIEALSSECRELSASVHSCSGAALARMFSGVKIR